MLFNVPEDVTSQAKSNFEQALKFTQTATDATEKLFDLKTTLVVGLSISPDRLIQIRRNRLLSLKENRESTYIDVDAVRDEIVQARRLYERQGWPVIDVTRRSVEETAAAVLNLLHGGHGQVEVLG